MRLQIPSRNARAAGRDVKHARNHTRTAACFSSRVPDVRLVDVAVRATRNRKQRVRSTTRCCCKRAQAGLAPQGPRSSRRGRSRSRIRARTPSPILGKITPQIVSGLRVWPNSLLASCRTQLSRK